MVTLNNPTVTEGHGYGWDGTKWVKMAADDVGHSYNIVSGVVGAEIKALVNGVWTGLIADANGNLPVNATAQDVLPIKAPDNLPVDIAAQSLAAQAVNADIVAQSLDQINANVTAQDAHGLPVLEE